MELTNTQSSRLAKAIMLDGSYVSRLRSGVRPLPKNPVFVHDMSLYLADRVTREYQKGALCGQMQIKAWPESVLEAAAMIERWLLSGGKMPDLLDVFTGFSGIIPEEDTELKKAEPKGVRQYYYGNQGKQEAVLQFFRLILKEKTPQTLLLRSEEEMGWLYEDPKFAAAWAQLFGEVLKAGNRVRIIHNVGRDINQMLEGMAKWIPIYATGMIEPYYYPKLRDGIVQRTLFIAPRTAAITGSSVLQDAEGMLNELIRDKEAIEALKAEFERFLLLCRPLMTIYTKERHKEMMNHFRKLLSSPGKTICMCDCLTPATMPEELARTIVRQTGNKEFYEIWKTFQSSLAGEPYYEIIKEPDSGLINRPIPFAAGLKGEPVCYTEEQWKAHVAHFRMLKENHPNYHVAFQKEISDQVILFVKEEKEALMIKNKDPEVALGFSESKMVHACWDYLFRRYQK